MLLSVRKSRGFNETERSAAETASKLVNFDKTLSHLVAGSSNYYPDHYSVVVQDAMSLCCEGTGTESIAAAAARAR